MFDLFSIKQELEKEEKSFSKELIEGEYSTVIEKIEKKEAKSGGEYYSIMFRVNYGEFKNFCIFKNYNTVNANETAQNIGRKDLAKLAISCGLNDDQLKSFMPEHLLNKLVNVFVKIEYNNYTNKNEAVIKYYKQFNTVNNPKNVIDVNKNYNPMSSESMRNDTIPF